MLFFFQLVKSDSKFCCRPVVYSVQFRQATFAVLLNYLNPPPPPTAKAGVKCALLRGHRMMVAVGGRGVGHLQRLMASLRPEICLARLWLTACLFLWGLRGCWDYFRVYVAPAHSHLNRISSSIKGGLLCITFIAFQVFLETCKSPPKNWISWNVLSFREILRILSQPF